jgi:hypothetical protein
MVKVRLNYTVDLVNILTELEKLFRPRYRKFIEDILNKNIISIFDFEESSDIYIAQLDSLQKKLNDFIIFINETRQMLEKSSELKREMDDFLLSENRQKTNSQ